MCITHVRVQVPPRAPKKGTGYPIGCPVPFCIFDFALKRGHMTGIYRLYFRAPHHPWESAYLRIVRHSRALHPLVPHIHNRAYALRQCTACGMLHYRCFQFIKDRIKGKSCFRATKNLEAIEASRFCVGGRYRTRTCDPLHVNRHLKLFIIFFVRLWSFPFRFIWFPAPFKSTVSTYSTQVCGCLCGHSSLHPNKKQ